MSPYGVTHRQLVKKGKNMKSFSGDYREVLNWHLSNFKQDQKESREHVKQAAHDFRKAIETGSDPSEALKRIEAEGRLLMAVDENMAFVETERKTIG